MAETLKLSFEWSQKLGVRELPQLDKNHQSTIRGLYVVGDLADAPIIKVALNQGFEVGERLAQELATEAAQPDDKLLDVVVIGAGPAGIGAALALEQAGARYVVLERERAFNTIQNFPKAKLIFSEPHQLENKGGFWFDDAAKEELVERWERAIDERRLLIQQPEEVLNIERSASGTFRISTKAGEDAESPRTEQTYRARRVILAIGRRGAVNRLGIPGEELDKVDYALRDPAEYAGQRLLVVGGGDSAVESAIACAQAGADVTIAYRGEAFNRAKSGNRQRISELADKGALRILFVTTPQQITEDDVLLQQDGRELREPYDAVLIFAGSKLPHAFLRRIGVRMSGAMDWLRASWIVGFALLTYLFYVLKTKRDLFPFGKSDFLGAVPKLLEVDLGFRTVNASFWGTCIYALLILVFGVRAYRKYPAATQKRRYLSLIAFQWVFLFGIPEIVAPLVITLGNTVPELLARGYKFYAISVPWPLSIWSLVDGPGWGASEGVKHVSTNISWIIIGALTTFVAIPLYVRSQGERFCSYLCGCGGLAETLGDFWRHLAPRGRGAAQAEWFGRAILLLAIPVTLLILNDAWRFFAHGALYSTKAFAAHWYGLMVDFWLASVVGVALYPYLGNRVWCRFFCPLRAYMEVLARRISRIAIRSNDHCIGCGECTRMCQMGIQVQKFAQQQRLLDNTNSNCIQCGICVQVCPMDVLSVDQIAKGEPRAKGPIASPCPPPR